ncbi:uncharacterized protein [Ptychodera flava]|uniref:uncharacterized protein n=1 Tax=Ptychodera flava TaxID=63121 RepID=UPI00396A70B5
MLLRGFLAILTMSILISLLVLLWLILYDDYFGRGYLPRPKTENKNSSGKKDTMEDTRGKETSSTSLKWQQTPFKSVNKESSTRILLYINPIGRGGPNCQYGHFKHALQYSLAQNRSLVNAIMFYEHLIFGAHEQLRNARTLEETFDINQLKKIVNIISLEEFNANCNKTVEYVLTSPKEGKNLTNAYLNAAKLYHSAFVVALPQYEHLPATKDQLTEQLERASSMNCVGVWALSAADFSTRTTHEKVAKHLVPSLDIRHSADSIHEKVLRGRPYLAIHWRNKPKEIYDVHCEHVDSVDKKRCEYFGRDLGLMMNLTRNIAKSIQNFMKTKNLTQVYVASPPISTNFVQVLRNLGVASTFSAENITSDRYTKTKNDPYIWSLVEQEICANADVFVRHYNSTWAQRVRTRRLKSMAKSLTIKDFAANYTNELFSRRR